MESQDNYIGTGSDVVIQSKEKKKKRKHIDEEVAMPPIVYDDVPLCDEIIDKSTATKKHKKKKNKSKDCDETQGILDKHVDKKVVLQTVVSDDSVAPCDENPDEPITKKKHKRKKKKLKGCDEETVILDDAVTLGDCEDKHTRKTSKKKKRKSEDLGEEITVVSALQDNMVSSCDGGDASDGVAKKKSKKKKKRPEHEEILATSLIPIDVDDGTPVKKVKKKKKRRDTENVSSVGETSDTTLPQDLREPVENESPVLQCLRSQLETSEFDLKKMYLHLPEEPVCPICQKLFKGNRYRNAHVRVIHLKIKRFICDVCSTRFGDKTTLRVHKRLHTDERNYPCRYCSKVCRNSSNLHYHQRKHLKRRDEGADAHEVIKRLKTNDGVRELARLRTDSEIREPVKMQTTDEAREPIRLEELEELEDEDELVERLVARSRRNT